MLYSLDNIATSRTAREAFKTAFISALTNSAVLPAFMQKFTARVLLFPALLTIPWLVGGCGQVESTLASLRENPVLKNAAQGVLMGKSYDRAAIAARNNDPKELEAAARELAKVDPLAAAEQLVSAAAELDGRAMMSKDEKVRKELEAMATQKYWEALRVSPDFPSKDAQLLNALGYFLADRGKSKTDFQKAEKFTRASLKIWDALITEAEGAPMSGPVVAVRKFLRAQGPQDSLAWALFKQGRFAEARREQIEAIKETEKNLPVGEKVSAELYFHLGEMERALKNPEAARKQYQMALKVEPDHAPSVAALRSLTGNTPAPTNPVPAIPVPNAPPMPDEAFPDPLESGALTA